jgi:hypothetical protein
MHEHVDLLVLPPLSPELRPAEHLWPLIPPLARFLWYTRVARRIHLRADWSVDELERRYRGARDPRERSWWQILWWLARGQLAKDIAESTGYSRYWIGQIAKRHNAEGEEGMRNRQ